MQTTTSSSKETYVFGCPLTETPWPIEIKVCTVDYVHAWDVPKMLRIVHRGSRIREIYTFWDTIIYLITLHYLIFLPSFIKRVHTAPVNQPNGSKDAYWIRIENLGCTSFLVSDTLDNRNRHFAIENILIMHKRFEIEGIYIHWTRIGNHGRPTRWRHRFWCTTPLADKTNITAHRKHVYKSRKAQNRGYIPIEPV